MKELIKNEEWFVALEPLGDAQEQALSFIELQISQAREEERKAILDMLPEMYHQLDGYSPMAFEMGWNKCLDEMKLELFKKRK